MTTATKPRATRPRGTALQELERLEAEHRDAADAWSTVSREFSKKLQAARELSDKRQGLIIREPELVDPDQRPLSGKDNPVAKVDRDIEKLGDLEELRRRVEHADRIAKRRKQDVDAYIRANYPAIIEGLRPEAQAVAIAVGEAIDASRAAAERYLGFIQRVLGLDAANPGANRRVPGHDAVSELRRQLDEWDLPVPLPELPER